MDAVRKRSVLVVLALLVLLGGLAAVRDDRRNDGPAPERLALAGRAGELWRPAGRPRGVALVVHGGAWSWTGGAALASQRPQVQRLLDAGWVAVNVDHAVGRAAVADVRRWARWTAQRFGSLPLCVVGASSGAHLALLAAERLGPRVDCAVSWFGVLDFEGLRRSPVLDAKRLHADAVEPFFGSAARFDPVRRVAPRLAVPTLLVTGAEDPITPAAQATAYARAAAGPVEVVTIPPGDVQADHSGLDADGLARAAAAQRRLLDRVAAGRGSRKRSAARG